MCIIKRIGGRDDVVSTAGDSTDHKVTHLTLSHTGLLNMEAISQRFRNIDALELINCTIMRAPDMTAWALKRRLTYILCTRVETADALHDAFKSMPGVYKVKRCQQIHIQIKWRIP